MKQSQARAKKCLPALEWFVADCLKGGSRGRSMDGGAQWLEMDVGPVKGKPQENPKARFGSHP